VELESRVQQQTVFPASAVIWVSFIFNLIGFKIPLKSESLGQTAREKRRVPPSELFNDLRETPQDDCITQGKVQYSLAKHVRKKMNLHFNYVSIVFGNYLSPSCKRFKKIQTTFRR
jgi:hypothetical protein